MKANCYKCIYRGTIPMDAHSCCKHPEVKIDTNFFGGMADVLAGKANEAIKKLEIRGTSYGISSGWCVWPANFDPTWLENCNGFKEREK